MKIVLKRRRVIRRGAVYYFKGKPARISLSGMSSSDYLRVVYGKESLPLLFVSYFRWRESLSVSFQAGKDFVYYYLLSLLLGYQYVGSRESSCPDLFNAVFN